MFRSFALLLLFFTNAASAQSVNDCAWQASAWNLAEPWEANTRTFANGDVRLAILDTIEPAVAAYHVLVLSPPYGPVGDRQCRVISLDQGTGFANIDWTTLDASYDPAIGLTFHLQVQGRDPATAGFVTQWLTFTVNQASGQIHVWLQ